MTARRLSRITVLALAGVLGSTLGAAGAAWAADPTPTRTVLSTTPATVGAGQAVKLKAVVKAVTGTAQPTGNVTFAEGAVVLGSAPLALVGTAQTAKLTVNGLTVGAHQLTATFDGSAAFETSTSLPVLVTVTLPATVTNLTTSTPSVLVGKDAKLKAVVKMAVGAAKPTGTVTFSEGATVLGTVNLALVGTIETAKLTVSKPVLGPHTIVATYNGTATVAGSTSAPVTFTVVKATTTTTVTATAGGAPGEYMLAAVVDALAPATGVPTGNVRFVVDGSAPQIVALSKFGRAPLDVVVSVGDSHTVRVTYVGDAANATSVGTLTFIG